MRLESFYEQHKDELINALTHYSRDHEAAADAVQDSFLKALKNTAKLSDMQEKTLWSWLYTTAKNALIDGKRRSSRIESYDVVDEIDTTEDLEDMILIGDLLYKLPPNLRYVVSVRYFGGMNATEIGKMLGIPPATIRSQIRSALSLMKKYLKTT